MDQQLSPGSPSGNNARPRAGSHSFSLRSSSSGGKHQVHAPTQHDIEEKRRRDSFMRGESKANPNAAVQEAQPATRNVLEKVTLESVRSVASKDAHGNFIAEPDLANPTRSRWERPLDTIRSFEKAVDGDYHRRTVSRAASDFGDSQQHTNQRNSYYQGNQSRPNGHYGNRTEGYYDGAAPPATRARYGRVQSDGARYYNGHSSQQYGYNNGSHEGSDSTGPWGNGTDPSSQNSSYERLHGIGKRGQSPEQAYGMDAYANAPINEESDDYGYPARPQQRKPTPSYGMASAPQGDYAPAPPRQTISLGNSAGNMYQNQGGSLPSTVRTPTTPEKQKGRLSRLFSKSK